MFVAKACKALFSFGPQSGLTKRKIRSSVLVGLDGKCRVAAMVKLQFLKLQVVINC